MGIFENTGELSNYIWLFLGSAVFSALLTYRMIDMALQRGWTVEPIETSSHEGVKPVGGGGVVIILTLTAWLIVAWPFDPLGMAVFAGTVALGVISWIDDLRMVSLGLRLSLQIAAVALVLTVLPVEQRILPGGFPLIIERLATGFCWVWFINLYNFMDGIDGLTASETIAICLGFVLIGNFVGLPFEWLMLAVVLGGATTGFLPWNWHHSRIMLGDLGAIPIGFLVGFLLINLAFSGYVVAALVLPLYFLVDASITLVHRILEGKKFWQPHKEHFYQRTVQAGLGHGQVVLRVIGTNIILIGAAFWSISQPMWAALVAVAAVVLLMVHFHLKAMG